MNNGSAVRIMGVLFVLLVEKHMESESCVHTPYDEELLKQFARGRTPARGRDTRASKRRV